MIQGLQFVMVHVPEVAALEEFYTRKLGLSVVDRQPGFLQFAPEGGAALALGEDAGRDHVELWWFVDDADATFAQLQARGVEVAQPPTDMPFGRTFAIKDPAGNALHMLQLPSQG